MFLLIQNEMLKKFIFFVIYKESTSRKRGKMRRKLCKITHCVEALACKLIVWWMYGAQRAKFSPISPPSIKRDIYSIL